MKWVSVKDRLPERGEDVLVLGEGGTISVRHIPKIDTTRNCHGNDGKSWYPGGWGIAWTTHWMPLPEPPKEKNDGNNNNH